MGGVGWILGGSYFFSWFPGGGQTFFFESTGGVRYNFQEIFGGSNFYKKQDSVGAVIDAFSVKRGVECWNIPIISCFMLWFHLYITDLTYFCNKFNSIAEFGGVFLSINCRLRQTNVSWLIWFCSFVKTERQQKLQHILLQHDKIYRVWYLKELFQTDCRYRMQTQGYHRFDQRVFCRCRRVRHNGQRYTSESIAVIDDIYSVYLYRSNVLSSVSNCYLYCNSSASVW